VKARHLIAAVLIAACGGKAEPNATRKTDLTTSAKTPPSQTLQRLRTFVLFADVTRSLNAEEQASVISDVKLVIDIIPPKSRLYVFPLLEDVQRAGALFTGEMGEIQGTSDAVAADQQRAIWRNSVAQKLTAMFNGPANGRNLTCVSGALQKADEIQADATENTEIIIVSDMLEDCKESLLGGVLKLEKTSIANEIHRAQSLPPTPLLQLNGASVTAILPTIPTSKQKVLGPPVSSLKTFWRAVLDRCGDRSSNFRFGTEIPQRLLDLKPRPDGAF
jgi:hypothetical protein